jgi:hypothetical protein
VSKSKGLGSVEPYFYVALVLRGTEAQYLDALRYIQSRNNGAQVIYQCKSLAYLRVVRDDGVRIEAAVPELAGEAKTSVRRGGAQR